MACSSCAPGKDGKPGGCNSNGGCGSGGCNRLNTFDWLSTMEVEDPSAYGLLEISFKQGSRKGFFHNPSHVNATTGDMVVVDTGNGWNVGKVSLSGELVRMQMRKKKVKEDSIINKVIRIANYRDLEKLADAREDEKPMMVRSRVIARTLDLKMKIGDVEIQADRRKATFFYTADGRVDFRELIRQYAKEFRIKIEMRQIGARQESARIGGIGSCGRELCCSTWLSDFKSVSTAAARYQNLAINQAKLSGQCGRLKCCLNYELDSYMDALGDFPKGADKLRTEAGNAVLVKTDVFKRLMFYCYEKDRGRGKFYALHVDKVKEILEMNRRKEMPVDLNMMAMSFEEEEDTVMGVDENLTGVIELPMEKRKKKKKRPPQNNRGAKPRPKSKDAQSPRKKEEPKQPVQKKKTNSGPDQSGDKPKSGDQQPRNNSKNRNKSRHRNKNRHRNNKNENRNNNNNNDKKE